METRLAKLEADMLDLRLKTAEVNHTVLTMKEAVDELKEVVQELRDTMNRGRGAIWVFGTLSVIIGGAIEMVIRKISGL